jgi:cholest-4-en-3-one 26-monooxygenase
MNFDPRDLVDPMRYAERGYPHELYTRLRAEAPVVYVKPPDYEPFWAVTRYTDILEVLKQPELFSSAQGITLLREGQPPHPPSEVLVLVDPPRHGPMRRLVNGGFTPRAVRDKADDVERIALDVLAKADGTIATEGDFVAAVAAPFPLAVMAWILGVPESDWGLLFRWTNEVIGREDPEYRQPGETPMQTFVRARNELRGYLGRLIEQRRSKPGDDFVSALLAGTIDGRALTEEQLLSYCELLVEAGNETTRNAISGGLIAFCEHPDAWTRLRAEPELMPEATEEILRWVSPINYFKRVATADTELRGTKIAVGDQVAIYFASANRDEEMFDDPFTFRIDRRPNQHLTFGFGEHVCLGAHLARLEMTIMFKHLLTLFEAVDLAGEVRRLQSAVNGSIKQLPVRYHAAAR